LPELRYAQRGYGQVLLELRNFAGSARRRDLSAVRHPEPARHEVLSELRHELAGVPARTGGCRWHGFPVTAASRGEAPLRTGGRGGGGGGGPPRERGGGGGRGPRGRGLGGGGPP